MKCDNCNKNVQQNSVAITVGDIKICQLCVNNAASGRENTVINDVLAYINTYRHGSNKRKMREACSGFYTEEEIFGAKTELHSKNPSLFGEFIKRRDSPAGGLTKEEANLDDVYDWFRKLDDNEIPITTCASNLRRVPKFNPEEAEKTSMLERIIQLEEAMKSEKETHLALLGRTSKLEEKVFSGSESLENKLTLVTDNLTKTETQVVKMSNNVNNIDKEVKSQKDSFSDALKSSLSQIKKNISNGNNTVATNNGSHRNNFSVQNADNQFSNNPQNNNLVNNEWSVVGENKRKKKALLGTARPVAAASGSTSKVFGAPPPSRHFVLERILNEITEEDIKSYINNKNGSLEVRSLECMSHESSRYKKFKLEISVEDCQIVYAPDFWPFGTRIRPFFRRRNGDDDRPFRRTDDETGD